MNSEMQKRFDILMDLERESEFEIPPEMLAYLQTTVHDGKETGGFLMAPASSKYHGAYDGGLFDHSVAVYKRLKDLTEKNNLKWKRPQSPFIVGVFHDLCKCDQYKKIPGQKLDGFDKLVFNEGLFHYEYNPDTLLKGHGDKSVLILSRFINLTEEEMLCIRFHMGAYEKDDWADFDMAIRKYENVLWTHMADQLASKIDNV